MSSFHGLIVYEIVDNGRILNGIYASSDDAIIPDFMSTEIATNHNQSPTSVVGSYDLKYEDNGQVYTGTMEIKLLKGGMYKIEQRSVKGGNFEGFGVMSGNRNISFSYWKTDTFIAQQLEQL